MPRYDFTPVQILRKTSDGIWKLDEHALKNVLRCSWNEATAIISICGDKRKGKSFLLNLLMHNLSRTVKDKLLSTFFGGEKLSNTFKWRGGTSRDTEGIWITDQPIPLTTKGGNVHVYIVDTQGMFDNTTTKHECTQIFTLSTLMSSIVVFNLLRQLQSNDIEQLSFWMQSAQWVGNEKSKPVLQNLFFLIRDFPHENLGYGLKGGEAYLKQQIEESKENGEITANLEELKKVFQRVSAYAMPFPGDKVAKRGHNEKPLKLKDIASQFLQYANEFFQHLKKDIGPLTLNKNPMNGSDLYTYIVKCSELVLTGEMPKAKDLSDLVADHWMRDLVEKCVEKYQDKIKNLEKGSRQKETLTAEKDAVMKFFDDSDKFGRKNVIQDARNVLQVEVDRMCEAELSHDDKLKDARSLEEKLMEAKNNLKKKYVELAEKHKAEAHAAHGDKEKADHDNKTSLEEKSAKSPEAKSLLPEMPSGHTPKRHPTTSMLDPDIEKPRGQQENGKSRVPKDRKQRVPEDGKQRGQEDGNPRVPEDGKPRGQQEDGKPRGQQEEGKPRVPEDGKPRVPEDGKPRGQQEDGKARIQKNGVPKVQENEMLKAQEDGKHQVHEGGMQQNRKDGEQQMQQDL